MVLRDERGLPMEPPPVLGGRIGSHDATARHEHNDEKGEKHEPRHRCNPLEHPVHYGSPREATGSLAGSVAKFDFWGKI